ncbi:hypothetical protein DN748_03665 [Sinomicrobium soli]|nr:hypothetical protein DN748_03665 [Sinomicrobium sp. N-1-3-6]
MLPCINKQILGVECPGCGMQRAVALLFEGDFTAAFYMYPAIYPLILFFISLLADHLWKKKNFSGTSSVLAAISVVVILGNYIMKFI